MAVQTQSFKSFQTSSQGLHLQVETEEPSFVPNYAVQKVRDLRDASILPQKPDFIVVNTHGEMSVEVLLSSSNEANELFELIYESNIRTIDNHKLNLEPKVETLDFYVENSLDNITKRLRFYSQNGEVVGSRVILADVSPREEVEWSFNGFDAKARSECIIVLRDDINKDTYSPKEEVKLFTDKFFKDDLIINAVVHKQVNRGNFGRNRRWDHRPAVYKSESGEYIDATKKESILGMGSYVVFQAQEIHKYINYKSPIKYSNISEIINNLVKGDSDFENSYSDILKHKENKIQHAFRVELEAKGMSNHMDGAYLTEQMIGRDGILMRNNIDFRITAERKVTA